MHIAGSYTGPHKQQLEESTSWAWRVHESLGIGSQFMTDSSKIGSFGFMELDVWQKRGDEMEWWNMRSLICTPPKFNIAPEKWCLEDYFAIGKVTWAMLNFRVCIYIFFVFIMYIELKAEVFPASTDFLIEKQQDVKAQSEVISERKQYRLWYLCDTLQQNREIAGRQSSCWIDFHIYYIHIHGGFPAISGLFTMATTWRWK